MAGRTIIESEDNLRRQTLDLYISRKSGAAKEFGSLEWVPWGEGQEAPGEPLRLEREDAQSLFNLLWSRGYRPPGNSVTEYQAQGKHLEDMRALAFGKLGVTKP